MTALLGFEDEFVREGRMYNMRSNTNHVQQALADTRVTYLLLHTHRVFFFFTPLLSFFLLFDSLFFATCSRLTET
jgi:hypothetical protein